MSMILGNIFSLVDIFRGIKLFTGGDKGIPFYRPARVGSDARFCLASHGLGRQYAAHSGWRDKSCKAIAERVAGYV